MPHMSTSLPPDMAQRRLSGCRVVTTRERRGALDSALATAGADVIHVPLIAIERPLDGGAALERALAGIDGFDWVVVTSQHGARLVGEAAAGHRRVRLAAVGARSGAILAGLAGRAVDVVPERQTAADLAAAMPAGSGRVLLAQADRADGRLADELARRGYAVAAFTAYRTALRVPTVRERVAALSADALVIASGSAADAWVDAIGVDAPPVVAAIGPVTAAAAERRGLKVTHVATDHDVEGLREAVIAALTASVVESVRPRP